MLVTLLYAATESAPATAGTGMEQSGMMTQLLMIGAIFVLFYFLILAPNRKEQKKHAEMLKALKPGDKIITSGGIVGVIEKIIDAEDIIRIRTGESTLINMKRSYVSAKADKPAETAPAIPEKK